jgi:glutamate racemase
MIARPAIIAYIWELEKGVSEKNPPEKEIIMEAIDPIGVFDSGLGGLTLLAPAARVLPRERFIYYGDNAHAPYGSQSREAIAALALACARELAARGAKMLVIACNTATAAAAGEIRAALDIPVVAMEPALKPALALPGPGPVAVLATPATLALPRFRAHAAGRADVIPVPLPGLVERIESGDTDGPRVEALLREALAPVLARRPRALVLGCTHFPFAKKAIARVAGPAPVILDGTAGTVAQMHRRLAEQDLLNPSGPGGVEFFSSAGPETADKLAALYAAYAAELPD